MYCKRVGCTHVDRIGRQLAAHDTACHLCIDIIYGNTAGDTAAERPGRYPCGHQAGLQCNGIGSTHGKG